MPLLAALAEEFEGGAFFEELLPQVGEVGVDFVLGFGEGCEVGPDDFDEGSEGEGEGDHADDAGD